MSEDEEQGGGDSSDNVIYGYNYSTPDGEEKTGSYVPTQNFVLIAGSGDMLTSASQSESYADYEYQYHVLIDDNIIGTNTPGTYTFKQKGTFYVSPIRCEATFKSQTFNSNSLNNPINVNAGDTINVNNTNRYGFIVISKEEL